MTRTILVADDHPLFRQALAMAAASVRPMPVLLNAHTFQRL